MNNSSKNGGFNTRREGAIVLPVWWGISAVEMITILLSHP